MSETRFDVPEPGKFAKMFPLIIGTLPTLVILVALQFARSEGQVPTHVYWLLLLLPLVAGLLAWSMHHPHLQLRDGVLSYGWMPWRRVPVAKLDLDAALIVDLEERPALRPGIKIAGSRLPGYASGWFKLRDGRRAFVLLTDRKRVLVLPRRDSGVLMFSLVRPDSALAALRAASGR